MNAKSQFCSLSVCFVIITTPLISFAQVRWVNVDSFYQPLPPSVHIFRTTDSLDGKPNIAYYVEADLKDRNLNFTSDTTYRRRLTPGEFYQKNDKPLLVVNTTFFSFATHQNLNVVIKNSKMLGYNSHSIPGRGKDTFTYRHHLGSAIGISKKRKASITWVYTDSALKHPHGFPTPVRYKDSLNYAQLKKFIQLTHPLNNQVIYSPPALAKWKMKTAVGGGPVLLMNGEVKITNEEELKFTGKGILDKHPRTGMGYTMDNKLIILVVEGRHPGIAEGASLVQEAQLLKDIGCFGAINLDGGGSSCMLVNGKPTITVSDAAGQRPVPGIFIIGRK